MIANFALIGCGASKADKAMPVALLGSLLISCDDGAGGRAGGA